MSTNNINSKNKRIKKKAYSSPYDTPRKFFKKLAGTTFELFVNLIIIFLVIKLFSYAFNFTYSVFGEAAKDPNSREVINVLIDKDDSIKDVGEKLQDAGVIEDKFAFYVKGKIIKAEGRLIPGKYSLSPSMTLTEIFDEVCPKKDDEEKDEKKSKPAVTTEAPSEETTESVDEIIDDAGV